MKKYKITCIVPTKDGVLSIGEGWIFMKEGGMIRVEVPGEEFYATMAYYFLEPV
jgi:hypothetical protein